MTHPITGIDHVFLLVRDLDAAAEQYRRLGFTVSPRGLHSAHMGSANHTIMLEGDYFELLGILRETPQNAPRRAKLAEGEGLAAIACQVDDTRAAVSALAELGIATGDAADFERPVPLPAGGTARAAFTVASFAPAAVPHGDVFMCQHHTPDTVWLPELVRHANTARTLDGILAAVADPAAVGEAYARLFRAGTTRAVDGGVEVATGNTPLTCLTADALGRRYPGLSLPTSAYAAMRIAVGDLDAARRAVRDGGVAIHPTTDGFAVAPADAAGAIVEFVA